MIAIIVSVLAGVFVVFGRIFNSKMAEKMGLFQGALINYIAGLIISILLTLVMREYLIFSHEQFMGIPLWAYLGGILGIGIVVLSSYLTHKVSAFYLTLLIFLGQLATGVLIDYFVTQTISTGKILGGCLVIAGFLYNLKIDHQEDQLNDLKHAA
ncbi:MAG: DMT family transporter [Clostridiales bacterium]|nr:DMT family transporter [Clostridiales bacterium]